MFDPEHIAVEQPLSTAAQLRQDLSQRGIPAASISKEHLSDIYAGLNDTRFRPDFSLSTTLCGALTRPVPQSDVIVIIVETRPHPFLERLIVQTSRQIDAPIFLLHSAANRSIPGEPMLRTLQASERLKTLELPVSELTGAAYSGLFLQHAFWRWLSPARHVLTLQTDGALCERSEFNILDFGEFDYVGARWNRQRPVGILADGGYGGVSLRRTSAHREALERFPPEDWTGGEDGYFSFHLDLMGGRISRGGECDRFCAQDSFAPGCFAVHKPGSLSDEDQIKLRAYAPETAYLFEEPEIGEVCLLPQAKADR